MKDINLVILNLVIRVADGDDLEEYGSFPDCFIMEKFGKFFCQVFWRGVHFT